MDQIGNQRARFVPCFPAPAGVLRFGLGFAGVVTPLRLDFAVILAVVKTHDRACWLVRFIIH